MIPHGFWCPAIQIPRGAFGATCIPPIDFLRFRGITTQKNRGAFGAALTSYCDDPPRGLAILTTSLTPGTLAPWHQKTKSCMRSRIYLTMTTCKWPMVHRRNCDPRTPPANTARQVGNIPHPLHSNAESLRVFGTIVRGGPSCGGPQLGRTRPGWVL